MATTKKKIVPKQYKTGGNVSPIYVDSPDDPRFKEYQRRQALKNSSESLVDNSYYNQNLKKKQELQDYIDHINFNIDGTTDHTNRDPLRVTVGDEAIPLGPNRYTPRDFTNDRPVILRTKPTTKNKKEDKTTPTYIPKPDVPFEVRPPQGVKPPKDTPTIPTPPVGSNDKPQDQLPTIGSEVVINGKKQIMIPFPNKPVDGTLSYKRSISALPKLNPRQAVTIGEVNSLTPEGVLYNKLNPEINVPHPKYTQERALRENQDFKGLQVLYAKVRDTGEMRPIGLQNKLGQRISWDEYKDKPIPASFRYPEQYQQGGSVYGIQSGDARINSGLNSWRNQWIEEHRGYQLGEMKNGYSEYYDPVTKTRGTVYLGRDYTPEIQPQPVAPVVQQQSRDQVNVAPIGSVAPTTSIGTTPSRQVQEPNVQEHNVLGDTVFIPVTKSGSYHNGEAVGSDRIVRYESVDGTKSYTKKEYEKLKKGQVKNHQYGGNVKKYNINKYQDGGLTNFEQRIQNPVLEIVNKDGRPSTHKMMSFEADGKFYAAPTIVEIDGALIELSPSNAMNYALQNNEYKEFKNRRQSENYANNGYKKNTPMDMRKRKVNKYQDGGLPLYDMAVQTANTVTGGRNIEDDIKNLPFMLASGPMMALMNGSLREKDAKQSDVFNPVQGFQGFNYQMGGNINTSGYTPGYPSFDNPENIIPLGSSKMITMENTPFPVLAIPDVGEPVVLKPGQTKKFPNANHVREIPMKNNKFEFGKFQQGGTPQSGANTQNPQQPELPDMFNNQDETDYVLGSFLPHILNDPRNTLNAGKRPLVPIQTEKGEYITSPFGDIVKVAANKLHKDQDGDDISDYSAEGNYILSNDRSMTIKKGKDGGVVKGVKLEDVLIGMDPMYYEEGKLMTSPKEYTLGDLEPNKSKYTFADLGEQVANKFYLTDRENDIFAKRAQVENKLSRVPYIQSIVELSELQKKTKDPMAQKFQRGGYAKLAQIYNPMLKGLNKTLQDGSVNGFYHQPDPLLSQKNMDNGMKPLSYQGGGYTYTDHKQGDNKREQWNDWITQSQTHYNNFALDAQRNNTGQFALNTLGILGQNAHQADNEFLYGNTYNSRLDNLKNQQDRSMNAEQSYYTSLTDRENSAYRLGMNSGASPGDFAPARANAIREQNSQVSNLGKERRSFADRYGVMQAQSSDMFAGRQNSQKAYLNDFSNNKIQNLAGSGTGYLQNKIAIQGANLEAQSKLQLAKQAGNGWTDFTNGLGDVVNALTGIISAASGFNFGGGGKQQQQQTPSQQQQMSGLNPTNWGNNMFQYSSQLYGPNPWQGYQPSPYQPSWSQGQGWGMGNGV